VIKGDIVLAVNGIACGVRHGLTLEKVKPLILGNPGTVVSSLPSFQTLPWSISVASLCL
jgi:hypothetical protein